MSWLSNWYHAVPVTFIIVVSGISVALVSTIIGIVYKGFWKDKGLITVDGKQLHWNKSSLPIVLVTHPDLTFAWVKAIKGAAKRLELAAVTPLFSIEDPVPGYRWDLFAPMGYVSIAMKPATGALQVDHAITEHRYDRATGRIRSAKVTFPSECPQSMAVAVHELLHVLGFDHDESPNSIMYPTLSGRTTHLSDKDIQLLKKLYK